MNVLAAEMLRKYVPNFVSHFVDLEIVDIIAVENQGDQFAVFSYDNSEQWFLVGVIEKNDDEDQCFNDQHEIYDNYDAARKAYKQLVENNK